MSTEDKIHWSSALASLSEIATRATVKPFTQPATLVDVHYVHPDILFKYFERETSGLHRWDMSQRNDLTDFLETIGVSKRAPVIFNFHKRT